MNKVFIIAEAGVNHSGNIKTAQKLIDAAVEAGADAIKFQTFTAEDLVIKSAKTAEYQKRNTDGCRYQLSMLKKLELSPEDFIRLKKYCDRKNILFLSTPHTERAFNFLDPLVPVHKISSGDLINIPFLKMVAKTYKPILLSTGMATLAEVKSAVDTIIAAGNKKIVILHCTSNYPCPPEEVNLKAMETLRKVFGLSVGYSDHTIGIYVPVMAVAMGATVIEKHFTLDKKLKGPDHKASLDPKEFKEMVRIIRCAEKAFGTGIKKPTIGEKKIKNIVRKSIVANINIPKGTIITRDMLTFKRPGYGLAPSLISNVIGKRTKRLIKKDSFVLKENLR
ncbi:N-acetylneuraminate synthase [Patescibacteria group bacterium]|nr:N-acetylneuraminate synthase [Patescibacteria group bacterium]